MGFSERLKGAGVALLVCVACAPLAAAITIALLPLWRWVEATFNVESIGHSGPAGWCYLAVYVAVLVCAALIWRVTRRGAKFRGEQRRYGREVQMSTLRL
jgi:hypothetical protein